ncbi:MAG: aminoacyl-histidine dipeptidase [Clostridium sp.]|nr:aminoacyl-histidine dipeptidase [Prevotella sp.]MCM1428536.1 aminoacyl-histidine dipeptidase [Clostridium sp.]MCM1474984.1 aminoacyl-histidine dipeptidase [Muribaculaceae bacterium]
MKITDLEPRLVWECFDEITKVPRPTHHLEKMKQFLVDWANRHNIPVKTDAVGNVAMSKPATKGHENSPRIILQGHQDMVAEKRGDKEHDFMTDPITTIVDGEWVKADGTTLGADNGMGCASAMAVLLDDSLVHGPIEALFTVDEEQGLIGANGLQPGFVSGDILLNLDSEEHGQLVIGCAGGKVTICTIPYNMVDAPEGKAWYRIHLNHFKGGHSGMEIGLGRGNANQQLCRFLWESCSRWGLQLAHIDGGGLANAIPREAYAIVGVDTTVAPEFEKYAREFSDMIHLEFALSEGKDFTFTIKPESAPKKVICHDIAHKLISAVFACPNGVQGMSGAVEGLIETSCNVASIKIAEEGIVVTVHQRSSVDSRRDEIADRVKALFEMIGARVIFDDTYVGWAPNPESKVLKIAEKSFEDLFGSKPRVEALHAGLECGLFLEKMPDLDMISFGPTLKDIHSPSEKANIKSVGEYWQLLTEILHRLADQKA